MAGVISEISKRRLSTSKLAFYPRRRSTTRHWTVLRREVFAIRQYCSVSSPCSCCPTVHFNTTGTRHVPDLRSIPQLSPPQQYVLLVYNGMRDTC
jgi:hypothetical protein